MSDVQQLSFTRADLSALAMVTTEAARMAGEDGRLHGAVLYHRLAARLWRACGYDETALYHSTLANETTNEILALAAGRQAA